ncbi:MAG: hypothetical protein RLZZ528_1193 [Pseudomonadota bacterium]
MTSASRWDDLTPRLLSAAVMSVLGFGLVVAGDPWISVLATAVGGIMTWEAAHVTSPARKGQAVGLGVAAAVVLGLLFWNHSPTWMVYLPVPALIGAILPGRDRIGFLLAALGIVLACYALVAFRGGLGLGFVLWVCLVVIASDTLGYFAGRMIGGPKFWPRLSPKKTWSGTIAGWNGAAGVGAAFWLLAGAPGWIVPFSALVALAGQMGDIGESAVKRRSGVKDASHLIPGHGGLMDRLDALSGAALFLLAWGAVLPLPAFGAVP